MAILMSQQKFSIIPCPGRKLLLYSVQMFEKLRINYYATVHHDKIELTHNVTSGRHCPFHTLA